MNFDNSYIHLFRKLSKRKQAFLWWPTWYFALLLSSSHPYPPANCSHIITHSWSSKRWHNPAFSFKGHPISTCTLDSIHPQAFCSYNYHFFKAELHQAYHLVSISLYHLFDTHHLDIHLHHPTENALVKIDSLLHVAQSCAPVSLFIFLISQEYFILVD